MNTNFGSSKNLNLTSEIGAEGATVTGGDTIGAWSIENPTRTRIIETRWLLTKGDTIAFTCTPPASNTSMVISIGLNAHLVTHDI